MIQQITCLVNQVISGAVSGLDNSFKRFFANLLSNFVNAVLEKFGGVAAFGHLLMALVDEVLQFREEKQGILLMPGSKGMEQRIFVEIPEEA